MNIKNPAKEKPFTMLMTMISDIIDSAHGVRFWVSWIIHTSPISRPQRIPEKKIWKRNNSSPLTSPPHQYINHGTHKAAAGLWQNTMRQLCTTKSTSSLERGGSKMALCGGLLHKNWQTSPKRDHFKRTCHLLSINFQRGCFLFKGVSLDSYLFDVCFKKVFDLSVLGKNVSPTSIWKYLAFFVQLV